jgi:hypothetical protein
MDGFVKWPLIWGLVKTYEIRNMTEEMHIHRSQT